MNYQRFVLVYAKKIIDFDDFKSKSDTLWKNNPLQVHFLKFPKCSLFETSITRSMLLYLFTSFDPTTRRTSRITF